LRILWHNLTSCVPNIFPSPPFSSGSGRGPASEAHSFSQSAPSPNSPVEWCAPAYAGQVLCYAFPPKTGSIASSPAHPKAQYVRPAPILQPCPFGGPVLSIEQTSQRASWTCPPPEDGRRYGCTLLYGGDTRGDATSHEVAPEDGSLISTGSSGSARHTATAKVVMNTSFLWGKLTGVKCLLQAAHVRTIPTSVVRFTRRRIKPSGYLTLPHLPFASSPRLQGGPRRGSTAGKTTTNPQAKLCPSPRRRGEQRGQSPSKK
jgi:hypothetical protein